MKTKTKEQIKTFWIGYIKFMIFNIKKAIKLSILTGKLIWCITKIVYKYIKILWKKYIALSKEKHLSIFLILSCLLNLAFIHIQLENNFQKRRATQEIDTMIDEALGEEEETLEEFIARNTENIIHEKVFTPENTVLVGGHGMNKDGKWHDPGASDKETGITERSTINELIRSIDGYDTVGVEEPLGIYAKVDTLLNEHKNIIEFHYDSGGDSTDIVVLYQHAEELALQFCDEAIKTGAVCRIKKRRDLYLLNNLHNAIIVEVNPLKYYDLNNKYIKSILN